MVNQEIQQFLLEDIFWSIVHNSERFAEFVPYDSRAFWKFFKDVRVKVERKELYGNKFVISFVVERNQSCMDASLLT